MFTTTLDTITFPTRPDMFASILRTVIRNTKTDMISSKLGLTSSCFAPADTPLLV
jgi:hypothetical protein